MESLRWVLHTRCRSSSRTKATLLSVRTNSRNHQHRLYDVTACILKLLSVPSTELRHQCHLSIFLSICKRASLAAVLVHVFCNTSPRLLYASLPSPATNPCCSLTLILRKNHYIFFTFVLVVKLSFKDNDIRKSEGT